MIEIFEMIKPETTGGWIFFSIIAFFASSCVAAAIWDAIDEYLLSK